ncbi:MAG: NADH-quinone oxidoreductase subunit L [Acidimicrobiia bacterium]|nr:NADH-quinone oxidoreductase subunit L [Acidimicrobiia bacterium]
MIDLIWLAIALPLGGVVVLLFFGRRLGEPGAGVLGTLTVAGSFVVAAAASVDFFGGDGEAHVVRLFDWIPALGLDAELLWDPLAAAMTLVVTGVGTLIHLYSISYMAEDERYSRFFTYLNLFVASMLILVLGANFGLLFVGWELVGLSSFLLISFWFTKPSAAAAGKKAFIVNRIGDFGFLIALMIIFATFGTFSYGAVFEEAAGELTAGAATAVALLLFVGAAGKSAQLPLHIWLPDAMEGPTPVSALIHAATMVTAGVYMVARTAALYELSATASGVVATVGIITAFGAATVALGQRDIKRVLAYSTISQLGYMFLGVGVGAYTAGIFHLYTHAFFKALLFLGAGSVIHAMAGEQDMRRMGGLRKHMPWTFGTMVVAWLAISGIPPLSGFWSKDEILAATFERGGAWVVLWAIGIVTALLTALYMARLMYLTFWTKPKWADEVHPHESPLLMVIPLVVLAGASLVAGIINTPWRLGFEHFLEPSFEGIELAHAPAVGTEWVLAIISVLAGLAGLAYATRRYFFRPAPPEESDTWRWVRNGYYVDNVYGDTIVRPGKLGAAWMAFVADQRGVDGLVNGVGWLVRRLGALLRPLQTGFVRSYGAAMMIGTVVLLVWLVSRAGL